VSEKGGDGDPKPRKEGLLIKKNHTIYSRRRCNEKENYAPMRIGEVSLFPRNKNHCNLLRDTGIGKMKKAYKPLGDYRRGELREKKKEKRLQKEYLLGLEPRKRLAKHYRLRVP